MKVRGWRVGTLAPVFLLALARGGAAQHPRVVAGFGVDTTAAAWSEAGWHGDVPAIYRAWASFLTATPGTPAADTLWSAAERERWPAYDLSSAAAHAGFPATILDIRPAEPGQGGGFVVKTLFAAATPPDTQVRAVALTRVFATRENGRWVFGNALPRLTAGWRRTRVGPITFVFPTTHRFDRARAERTARFADSLAVAFGVPKLAPMTYVVAENPEALDRVMGVDWGLGGQGYGYALAADHLLLNGAAGFGEANRHELTHYLLTPLVKSGRTTRFASEGVASWQGGSMGLSFPEMMRTYAGFLRAHPWLTIDSVLASDVDLGERPAGAMLARMVFERGGVPAVKALLDSGARDEELRASVQRLLAMPWAQVEREWRKRVEAYGDAVDSGPRRGRPSGDR